ncbi:MAG: DUF2358 domain-containing protein [Stenomitos rutilans HA7619-LM2]|jgi:hypothetical protein|nr:DUF2358 domain-containing protein [Stenomitos rutilans HA7619-LM2]
MTTVTERSVAERDYQERVETAIATLQHDLPTLFERDLSYDIYSREIAFRDPVNHFKGKFNYRIIFWTLRFHGQLFFTELHFDLHSVQQANLETIRADWTVRGTLRVPWNAKLLFHGYSIYTLNQDGLIITHVDTWDRSPREILKQFVQRGDRYV